MEALALRRGLAFEEAANVLPYDNQCPQLLADIG